MKFYRSRLAGALVGVLFMAGPALAQTPTPTLTPTVTPTPLTVTANSVHDLCVISSAASVCGRVRKAASQATTASYLFQQTAAGATYSVWVSCDDASGGTTKTLKALITRLGQSYTLSAAEVGPCTIGVTPAWISGTSRLVLTINGDHTMMALPTPVP